MAEGTRRPPFPGIRLEDLLDEGGNFDAESVADGLSRILRLHFEETVRTPSAAELAAVSSLLLKHASRHTVPASPGGEDPIDLSDLFDREDVRGVATAEATPVKLGRIRMRADLRGRGKHPVIAALQGFPLDMTGTVGKRGIVFDGEMIRPSYLAQVLVADVTVNSV